MKLTYNIVNDEHDLNLIHTVASDEVGNTIGSIDFKTYSQSPKVTLVDIQVEEAHRGKGIGKGMFDFSKEYFQKIGVSLIDSMPRYEEFEFDEAIEYLDHLGFEQPSDSMCYVGISLDKLLENDKFVSLLHMEYPGETLSEMDPIRLRKLKGYLTDRGIDINLVDIDYDCSCVIGNEDDPDSCALVAKMDGKWMFYYLNHQRNKSVIFVKALSKILKKEKVNTIGCLFRDREHFDSALEQLEVTCGPIIVQTLVKPLND